MAANAIDLCTLADVKAWLSIPTGTTTSDDLLQTLITAASAFINSWTERGDMKSAARVETRRGNGHDRMMTEFFPVTAVSKVMVDGKEIPAATGYTDSGYVFEDTSISLRGSKFCKGIQNVRLEYTAGYSPVPYDLQQACVEMVGQRFRSKDTAGAGISAKSLAGETISFSQKDMSNTVKAVLLEYRAVFKS